jgi:hypothetical protein
MMESESNPPLDLLMDKPTLDKISTNRPALERFVDYLKTTIVKKGNFDLVGLLTVASLRLERLCVDGELYSCCIL